MDSIDQAIMDMLKVNMGHRKGESIAIICQNWAPHLGDETKAQFEESKKLCRRMFDVYKKAGMDVALLEYIPTEAKYGVDVTPDMYGMVGTKDIIFMPTVFSLTWTKFREEQTKKGARVASMPRFTLEMFEKGGPMDVDYKEIGRLTKETAGKLRASKYVRITGPETDIVVHVEGMPVHASNGFFVNPGQQGNLPGAEAYVPPVHDGNSNGYFTVLAGWGGKYPLKHKATFYVRNGRFVDIRGDSEEANDYIKENLFPLFFGKPNHDVLAELGIGTNPGITEETMKRFGWTPLLSEKMGGTVHFANGNSKSMGGLNDVPYHMDYIVPNIKIEFNYESNQ